jgi:hypothetical protein
MPSRKLRSSRPTSQFFITINSLRPPLGAAIFFSVLPTRFRGVPPLTMFGHRHLRCGKRPSAQNRHQWHVFGRAVVARWLKCAPLWEERRATKRAVSNDFGAVSATHEERIAPQTSLEGALLGNTLQRSERCNPKRQSCAPGSSIEPSSWRRNALLCRKRPRTA